MERFKTLVRQLISHPCTHAKWLNTLSYLENCGAKKIARAEHPLDVSREMLKHASEEFRHAFYLKQQISTRLGQFLPTYHQGSILGGWQTTHYLDRLEVQICRLIKNKRMIYPLVTYAIEVRAAKAYPLYQELLIESRSSVSVRSILLEEKGHLEEMEGLLGAFSLEKEMACQIEEKLFKEWLYQLEN
jgi:hypothetical protein